MPKFIVHLYPLVRVKIKKEIEAATYEEAVEKATSSKYTPDFHRLFDNETDELLIEDGEEQPYALVDVVGDEEFEHSRWVHINVGSSFGTQLLEQFQVLLDHVQSSYWADRTTSVMPQWLSDAVDLKTQIEDDLKAQKAPPPEK